MNTGGQHGGAEKGKELLEILRALAPEQLC